MDLKLSNLDRPFLLAGPCSAETEEQVLEIARDLKKSKAVAMRAGIWKPRTKPGSFEGVGEEGLRWLKKAKEETGIPTATEVANPKHVELALKNDVDILWIGARTTVSPFNVQEIAEALKGIENPVLIKNPVNPDLALWMGAIERFKKQNIQNLGALHRGFSAYEKSKYRNIPEWQIPLDLKSEFPDLPLLLDPSHIAGNRQLIQPLCQTALDLNYDGFMIETHPKPDEAWSDAKQQITPEILNEIMANLNFKTNTSSNEEFGENLALMRDQISDIDYKILESLGKRMEIATKIGDFKRAENVSIFQPEHWKEILQEMLKKGSQHDLSSGFVKKFYKAIHQESIQHQQKE
jgi:chorismate mutase